MKCHFVLVPAVLFLLSFTLAAQTSRNSSALVSVPPVIQFSNIATDEAGNPLSGIAPITFSLYDNSQGGTALWSETQNVSLDSAGHYSAYLGITQANGIPTTLFTSGEAHWLGVKIASQPEQQPRIFLVSVPYAMKAGDAATVGGLPPSAFVMATPSTGSAVTALSDPSSTPNSAPPTNGAVTGSGTLDFLPLWDTTSDIVSSVLFQSGTGSTAKIGINTTTPATTLDVKGAATVRGTASVLGTLSLPATGAATSSAGKNSEPIDFTASAYNSGTSTAVNQKFQWQAQPINNDMSTASGTLNLLFGQGTAKPAETGLYIASNGQITFATGQTFPGTGSGTVTSVASGLGLTGGPITSSGTLQIDPTVVPQLLATSNAFTGSITASSFTGNGAGLTNVNAATLNGVTGSSFATLGANTFTGNQTVNGNILLPATNSAGTQGVISVGGNSFAFGSWDPQNAFLGFAGNPNQTGDYNTAVGAQALLFDTTGSSDTASGSGALYSNTTGSGNTAVGEQALQWNTTGSYNTSVGLRAGTDETTTNLNNATAIGAFADVEQSNSLVLGAILNTNNCTASTNCTSAQVGIGTTTPGFTLDVEAPSGSTPTVNFGSTSNPAAFTVNGTGKFNGLVTFLSTQTFPNVAELKGANTFNGNQTVDGSETVNGNEAVNGNLTVTSGTNPTVSIGTSTNPGSLQIGGTAFDYGSTGTGNAYVGFAGANGVLPPGAVQDNTGVGFQALMASTAAGSTGSFNTAVGFQALWANTGGSDNTAVGLSALLDNTTGGYNTATGKSALGNSHTGTGNTASGYYALGGNATGGYNTASGYTALSANTTGSNNTAVGSLAAQTLDGSVITSSNNSFFGANAALQKNVDGNGQLINNATAIGANAVVYASNALVLGSIYNVNNAAASVNVGIGTTVPTAPLDVEINSPGTTTPIAPFLWLKNQASIQSGTNGNSVDIRFTPDSGGSVGTPNAYIRAQEDGSGAYGTSLQFATVSDSGSGASEAMRITSSGSIGIGTTNPGDQLTVVEPQPSPDGRAVLAQGASVTSGNADTGLLGQGGDSSDPSGGGGSGLFGYAGSGPAEDGVGGVFSAYRDSTAGSDAIIATSDGGNGYGALIYGDVTIEGTLSATTKDFKIDHPLDPANKYLVHASVESSEMLNIYTGNTTTDAQGTATVQLPDWFEALNTDFRYQLTVIGQFAQAIVAHKIENQQFQIRTSAPDVEVSWQVTGVRQDAYAKAHPLVVEEEKNARLRGFYIHPELYGAPAEKQILWARHPRLMQRMKEHRMAVPAARSRDFGTRREVASPSESATIVPTSASGALRPSSTKPLKAEGPAQKSTGRVVTGNK